MPNNYKLHIEHRAAYVCVYLCDNSITELWINTLGIEMIMESHRTHSPFCTQLTWFVRFGVELCVRERFVYICFFSLLTLSRSECVCACLCVSSSALCFYSYEFFFRFSVFLIPRAISHRITKKCTHKQPTHTHLLTRSLVHSQYSIVSIEQQIDRKLQAKKRTEWFSENVPKCVRCLFFVVIYLRIQVSNICYWYVWQPERRWYRSCVQNDWNDLMRRRLGYTTTIKTKHKQRDIPPHRTHCVSVVSISHINWSPFKWPPFITCRSPARAVSPTFTTDYFNQVNSNSNTVFFLFVPSIYLFSSRFFSRNFRRNICDSLKSLATEIFCNWNFFFAPSVATCAHFL